MLAPLPQPSQSYIPRAPSAIATVHLLEHLHPYFRTLWTQRLNIDTLSLSTSLIHATRDLRHPCDTASTLVRHLAR